MINIYLYTNWTLCYILHNGKGSPIKDTGWINVLTVGVTDGAAVDELGSGVGDLFKPSVDCGVEVITAVVTGFLVAFNEAVRVDRGWTVGPLGPGVSAGPVGAGVPVGPVGAVDKGEPEGTVGAVGKGVPEGTDGEVDRGVPAGPVGAVDLGVPVGSVGAVDLGVPVGSVGAVDLGVTAGSVGAVGPELP